MFDNHVNMTETTTFKNQNIIPSKSGGGFPSVLEMSTTGNYPASYSSIPEGNIPFSGYVRFENGTWGTKNWAGGFSDSELQIMDEPGYNYSYNVINGVFNSSESFTEISSNTSSNDISGMNVDPSYFRHHIIEEWEDRRNVMEFNATTLPAHIREEFPGCTPSTSGWFEISLYISSKMNGSIQIFLGKAFNDVGGFRPENWVLTFNDTGDIFYNDGSSPITDSGYDFILDQWMHVAFQFDLVTDRATIYRNGEEILTGIKSFNNYNIEELNLRVRGTGNSTLFWLDALEFSWADPYYFPFRSSYALLEYERGLSSSSNFEYRWGSRPSQNDTMFYTDYTPFTISSQIIARNDPPSKPTSGDKFQVGQELNFMSYLRDENQFDAIMSTSASLEIKDPFGNINTHPVETGHYALEGWSFTNDPNYEWPSLMGIVEEPPDTSIRVISRYKGHAKVVKIEDYNTMKVPFMKFKNTNMQEGAFEEWFLVDNVTIELTHVNLFDNSIGSTAFKFQTKNGWFQYSNGTNTYNLTQFPRPVVDQWYFLRVDWNAYENKIEFHLNEQYNHYVMNDNFNMVDVIKIEGAPAPTIGYKAYYDGFDSQIRPGYFPGRGSYMALKRDETILLEGEYTYRFTTNDNYGFVGSYWNHLFAENIEPNTQIMSESEAYTSWDFSNGVELYLAPDDTQPLYFDPGTYNVCIYDTGIYQETINFTVFKSNNINNKSLVLYSPPDLTLYQIEIYNHENRIMNRDSFHIWANYTYLTENVTGWLTSFNFYKNDDINITLEVYDRFMRLLEIYNGNDTIITFNFTMYQFKQYNQGEDFAHSNITLNTAYHSYSDNDNHYSEWIAPLETTDIYLQEGHYIMKILNQELVTITNYYYYITAMDYLLIDSNNTIGTVLDTLLQVNTTLGNFVDAANISFTTIISMLSGISGDIIHIEDMITQINSSVNNISDVVTELHDLIVLEFQYLNGTLEELENWFVDQLSKLNESIYLVNDTLYNILGILSFNVTRFENDASAYFQLILENDEYLTNLYQKTVFSSVLDWSLRYDLMNDLILSTISNERDDIYIEFRYNGNYTTIQIPSSEYIQNYFPKTTEYRIYDAGSQNYITSWLPISSNITVEEDPTQENYSWIWIIAVAGIAGISIVGLILIKRGNNIIRDHPSYRFREQENFNELRDLSEYQNRKNKR